MQKILLAIADVDVVYELKDGVLIKNKVEDYHER